MQLTPYRLACCAACFRTKQVVGHTNRGDCADTARAFEYERLVQPPPTWTTSSMNRRFSAKGKPPENLDRVRQLGMRRR